MDEIEKILDELLVSKYVLSNNLIFGSDDYVMAYVETIMNDYAGIYVKNYFKEEDVLHTKKLLHDRFNQVV